MPFSRPVVGLGAALSVPVLAEGVETAQQLSFARASGCEELQGFHFGRPIPEVRLADMYATLKGQLTLDTVQHWQDNPSVHVPVIRHQVAQRTVNAT